MADASADLTASAVEVANAAADAGSARAVSANAEVRQIEVPALLRQKIVEQVEYYFGNSNLPRDRFLRRLLESNAGWADISVIAGFNKMRTLCTDATTIASVLRNHSALLEVSADGLKLRRVQPIASMYDLIQDSSTRTVYAKKFPTDMTFEQLQEFFDRFGHVTSIRYRKKILQRNKQKQWNGGVFIEYATAAEAQRVLKERLEIDGIQLTAETMASWKFRQDDKQRERREWLKRKFADYEEPPEKADTVVCIEGLPESASRHRIRVALIQANVRPRYIDMDRHNTDAYVRLYDEASAKQVAAQMCESKFAIDDIEPKIYALEGDLEQQYWKAVRDRRVARRLPPAPAAAAAAAAAAGAGAGAASSSSAVSSADAPPASAAAPDATPILDAAETKLPAASAAAASASPSANVRGLQLALQDDEDDAGDALNGDFAADGEMAAEDIAHAGSPRLHSVVADEPPLKKFKATHDGDDGKTAA